MKVYTATFLNNNYGSFLQAFALQSKIKEIGRESIIIQQNKKNQHDSLIMRIKRVIKPKKNYSYYRRLKLYFQNKRFSEKYKKIQAFKKQRLDVAYFNGLIDLSNQISEDDILLAGSDQIWSLVLGPLSGWYTFSCNEIPANVKKYSYAASIGLNELTEQQIMEYREALKDFSVVSFREHQAEILLSSSLSCEVRSDIDPTLLYDEDFWGKIASERLVNDRYIFIYMLRPDKHLIDMGKAIGKRLNCRVIYTGLMGDHFRGVDTICNAGIEDFISYIKYSEGVITNSFHGTVFSILFKKQFLSVRISGTSSRVDNLMDIVGLKSNYINSNDSIEPFFSRIDYQPVMSKLETERNKSLEYIRRLCGEGV